MAAIARSVLSGIASKTGVIRKIWEFGDQPELETASGPPEQVGEGDVEQTFTFHATRLNAGHVQGRLREIADANDLQCEVTVGSGLPTREIVVAVALTPS